MDSFLKGNKALLLGAIIVVALGLLLAGCGGGSQETPDENQGADTTPQEKIIRISASDVPNIDPGVGNDYVSSTAMCNLYDTLVFRRQTAVSVPGWPRIGLIPKMALPGPLI